MYLRILTAPVSVSTSTTHMCVPNGHEKFGGSYETCASRFGSHPSGKLCAVNAPNAIAASGKARSGEPLTLNVPFTNCKSSAEHSSWWAAISFAFSITLSQASAIATPPTGKLREPYVSRPSAEIAVSLCNTSTSSGATPSFSAAIIAHEVSCP